MNHQTRVRFNRVMVAGIVFAVTISLTALSSSLQPGAANSVMAQATTTLKQDRADTVPLEDDPAYFVFLPLIREPYKVFLPIAPYGNAAPKVSSPFPTTASTEQSLNAYLTWATDGDPEGDAYLFEIFGKFNDPLFYTVCANSLFLRFVVFTILICLGLILIL